jgi:acyl-CoA synthetase (NDP forming)
VGTLPDSLNKFKLGNQFIRMLLEYGYRDPLYPVGEGEGDVCGIKIYQSISEIPGPVDYVITAVQSKYVLDLVEECGRKGVRVMHFFTSGFSEIEDKSGMELQEHMVGIARRYGIRIIGPNCMGIYCPESGLAFGMNFSKKPGSVGYLAQSGGQCIIGVREANRRNIDFSKVVSYGNACDINECDLLEYLTDDPGTHIITAYIEGTNHGPRLLKALRRAADSKPVIVFKCADTGGGSQAAVSHTSAIAGSSLTWDALLRQTGAIRVYNVQEMFDVVTVLQRCPEITGLRTLVVGHGGGSCVQASDDCCRAGLTMPLLPPEYRQALWDIYKFDAGNIFKNPLDINPYWGVDKAREALAAVGGWDGVDLILLHSTPEQDPFVPREFQFKLHTDALLGWGEVAVKPVVMAMMVNTVPGDDGLPEKSFQRLLDAGFAAFPSVARASTALVRANGYYRRRAGRRGSA